MTNLKRLLLAMMMVTALTVTASAQQATKASIVGTPHDLTSGYTFGSATSAPSTNLCFFCHITHKTANNSASAPGYLLWNHTISSPSVTYGVYSSDTFTAHLGAAAGPTELGTDNTITTLTVSNLCLSCHDGTVAVASFYESTLGLPATGSTFTSTGLGVSGATFMPSTMTISDLTKSHPVHFQYTAALAAAASMTAPAGANGVDANGYVPLYGNNYMMECATCHDPHNGASAGASTTFPYGRALLVATTNWCTYCHK